MTFDEAKASTIKKWKGVAFNLGIANGKSSQLCGFCELGTCFKCPAKKVCSSNEHNDTTNAIELAFLNTQHLIEIIENMEEPNGN